MNSTAFTIVLNGALTIEACIRHHAPLFDRYIVVEGAALPGHDNARGDGRRLTEGKPNSTDGTVEILKQLEKEFDNLKVIYAKDCWAGKTAQCNAALEHALPGILWQIDADEFYKPRQMEDVKSCLEQFPETTAVEFWAYGFWPDTDHHCVWAEGEWQNNPPWRRVFIYKKGQHFLSHEPPRMNQTNELVLLRHVTRLIPVYLYHYGYVHRSQFEQREIYYAMKPGSLTDEYDRFFATGESPRQLVKFTGQHPIDLGIFKEQHANA